MHTAETLRARSLFYHECLEFLRIDAGRDAAVVPAGAIAGCRVLFFAVVSVLGFLRRRHRYQCSQQPQVSVCNEFAALQPICC